MSYFWAVIGPVRASAGGGAKAALLLPSRVSRCWVNLIGQAKTRAIQFAAWNMWSGNVARVHGPVRGAFLGL